MAALETLFNCVEAALAEAPGGHEDTESLRLSFSRLLLRRIAEHVLKKRGLEVPRGARLFVLSRDDEAIEKNLRITDAIEPAVLGLLAKSEQLSETDEGPLGAVFEGLLALEISGIVGARRLSSTRRRRRTGSFFTPTSLTGSVIDGAWGRLQALGRSDRADLAICDPACGAGAFLVAAARKLVNTRRATRIHSGAPFDERGERRWVVEHCIAGVDLDPLAVAVSELLLWTYVGDPDLPPSRAGRLHVGDALTGRGFGRRPRFTADSAAFDWKAGFPDRRERGFDLVIGNPPWIAYAGRASQPLAKGRRAFFAEHYTAFKGYPTLHAVFVERAAELAPAGVVALVVPSPLADLDGYAPARRALASTHAVCEPMLEFGQDAFLEVTQPCFALIAEPCSNEAASGAELGRPFRLRERARLDSSARTLEVPAALARLRGAERLPPELFREMGFQTTRPVTESLLRRGEAADAVFSYPLLEGREIGEFRVGPARLFLKPDPELLRQARCRLRPRQEYEAVRFVVRQTANVPIAALHSGLPFRNTLLAGFETEQLPAPLIVGLLNSSLYRAFHLSMQRDARQAVFPQVKVAHLRSLPRPPLESSDWAHRIGALVLRATSVGFSSALGQELDDEVFSLFSFERTEREETLAFLNERAPEIARARKRLESASGRER